MEFVEQEKYKNKFGIYCIINVISGDVYVGQTNERFLRRYWHHRWKLRDGSHDNQHLQRAWDLYGEDNFLFIPTKIVDDSDLLDELEIKYINIYRDLNHCYNIIDGGGGRKNVSLSDEHKRKIGEKNRANMLGKKHSEETKRKMSEVKKGKVVNRCNFVLNENLAFKIKERLVNGEKASDISKDMNIDYKLINNIIANNAWSIVHVDGWEDFRNNRKTYRRLTKEDHVEIYRLHIEEGYTKKELSKMYNRTDKMIAKIFKEQENLHNI